MRSKMETEDWKLGCFLDWKPKHKSVTCPTCGGSGYTGGHFKDLDGPQECSRCFGAKVISVAPTSQRPEIPADIREHMRRAWFDFYNQENSNG